MKVPKSSTLLIPAAALTLALMTAAPPARANNTYTYVGTAGGYLGSCANAQCNNGNGCRLFSQIFDKWYPSKSCDGAPTQGIAQCEETFRTCRVIQHWDSTGCTGTDKYDELTYQALCAGDGPAPGAK